MSFNVPSSGEISYDPSYPPGTVYGPFTEKTAMWQRFLTLANQHPHLVSMQVVGQAFPKPGKSAWDVVLFAIGNPNGGRVLWDALIHGNEDFGIETMYAIFEWLLTSGHPRAQRILNNNYVAFIPFVNWRWSRMNWNEDDTPCIGTDIHSDKGILGINLARDFKNGHQENCHDNYAPPGGYTQPGTQAMIASWNLWRQSRGWFYVNLHHGSTGRHGGGPRASEVLSKRRDIYAELFGESPQWNIGSSNVSYAPGDAVEYFDASAGFLIEMGGSDWRHTNSVLTSLTSGTAYKELLSLFVAQCELIEVTNGPECSTPSDCQVKHGNPNPGFEWGCVNNECVQVPIVVPPECTVPSDCEAKKGPPDAGKEWACIDNQCVQVSIAPECTLPSDCQTKHGDPDPGFRWICVDNKCVQQEIVVPPVPPIWLLAGAVGGAILLKGTL